MALTTLPYPNMDFVPLDILTANELDQLVANIDAINNATVPSASIASDAITTAKIADASVTNQKLADSSVGTTKIADGSVTSAKLTGITTYLATSLYTNATPNIVNVTLSSDYTNFDELEIHCAIQGESKGVNIMRFPTSSSILTLVHSHAGSSNIAYVDFVQYTLATTTMTRGNAFQKIINASNFTTGTSKLGILKVIGIKYN